MSVPRSYGRIEFPLSAIGDEIRNLLIEEGVRFKEDSLEIDGSLGDLEVEVKEGLFSMENSEARYGEFDDLETLLIEKGIPFDRVSGMDWNRPPERRIFRPGPPDFDHYYPLDSEAYAPVVSISTIQELLGLPMPTYEIQAYLEKHFPSYSPLADWVKQEVQR
ncbi:MAG: hypothetical protein M1438_11150 [Deltaproteobacteria bacterium]|nr:hypothetical protein [Deltaproteobacteria bacterium]